MLTAQEAKIFSPKRTDVKWDWRIEADLGFEKLEEKFSHFKNQDQSDFQSLRFFKPWNFARVIYFILAGCLLIIFILRLDSLRLHQASGMGKANQTQDESRSAVNIVPSMTGVKILSQKVALADQNKIQQKGISLPKTDLSSYQLVGISWDEHDYVAMIDRGPSKSTVFARKGESLGDSVWVKEIGEFSVTLSHNGKTWKLT